jgi:glycosyltransferase involved in cell wall biosynthesis
MAEIVVGGHVGLIVARRANQADGIRDYTRRLLLALRETAVDAQLWQWANGAPQADANGHPRSDLAAAGLDALVVQYNPFSFGRWGFAPELPLFLARLRRRRRRPRIAVMFHETYVDMRSVSWALMGSWQRVQLLAVQAAADVQLCSIQRWTERLRRTARGRPVHHLPVASNLPDARAHRPQTRHRLGAGADTVVLSCLGLRHPGRLQEHVLAAARAAGAAAPSVLLLDLGPGERSQRQLAGNVHQRSTGFLEEHDLAAHLAASDVFLAPYMDGVSTRRGSVMAALQHGLPVVGTAGHFTDDVLREASGLKLVPVGAADEFAGAVTSLARDARRRAELGAGGRELYERTFDWPVLVRRLRTHLDV